MARELLLTGIGYGGRSYPSYNHNVNYNGQVEIAHGFELCCELAPQSLDQAATDAHCIIPFGLGQNLPLPPQGIHHETLSPGLKLTDRTQLCCSVKTTGAMVLRGQSNDIQGVMNIRPNLVMQRRIQAISSKPHQRPLTGSRPAETMERIRSINSELGTSKRILRITYNTSTRRGIWTATRSQRYVN